MNFKPLLYIRFLLILAFIVSASRVFSQGDDLGKENYLGDYTVASSMANSFSKLSNLPVSPFTGRMSVALPLFEKKLGSLNFNMNLMYTGGGGIPADDPGSIVGRGWDLNVGGVVTRHKRGLFDDEPDGVLLSNIYINHTDGVSPIYQGDSFNKLAYDGSFATGFKDTEHDIFDFSFFGYSGKFYIGKNREVLLTQKSGLKITPLFKRSAYEMTETPGIITGFQIQDPYGNVYYFDKIIANTGLGYAVSWALTKAETSHKEESIRFYYNETPVVTQHRSLYPPQAFYLSDRRGQVLEEPSANNGWRYIYFPAGERQTYSTEVPKTELTLTSVHFSDKTKIDLFFKNFNSEAPILEKIEILSAQKERIKAYHFAHHTMSSHETYEPYSFETFFSKRQFTHLMNIKGVGKDGTPIDPVIFDYHWPSNFGNRYDYNFLAHWSRPDHWGFFGSMGDVLAEPSNTPPFPPANPIPEREPNIERAKAGVLKSVTYSSGVKNEFDYELNTRNSGSSDPDIVIGGLRIRTLTISDVANPQNSLIKEYRYVSENGSSSGFLGEIPQYTQLYNDAEIIYSNPVNALSYVDGSPVGYKRVEEKILNSSNQENGKIVYEYSDLSPQAYTLWYNYNHNESAPYHPIDRPTWAVGLLLKEKHYAAAISLGHGESLPPVLVKEIEHEYDIKHDQVYGQNYLSLHIAKVKGESGLQCFYQYPNCSVTANLNRPNSSALVYFSWQYLYKFRNYYPVTGYANRIKTRERTYSTSQPNQYVETGADYVYEPQYNFLRYVDKNNSAGQLTRHYTYYSSDFTDQWTGNKMLRHNMLKVPIATESWVHSNGSLKLWNASFTEYSELENGLVRPLKIYTTRYTEPQNRGPFPSVPANYISDRQLQPELFYTKYDEHGRLVETRNAAGMTSASIFDRSGNSIAVAVNAAYDNIAYASFDSEPTTGQWVESGSRTSPGFTGKNSFTGSISKTFPSSINAIVTAWVKNGGGLNVNNVSGTLIKSTPEWNFYKWNLAGVNTVTASGTLFDEVKCYPADAQMSTVVYSGSSGKIAEGSATDVTTFYTYNEFNQPELVKNEKGEILRQVIEKKRKVYFSNESSITFPPLYQGTTMLSYTMPKGEFVAFSETEIQPLVDAGFYGPREALRRSEEGFSVGNINKNDYPIVATTSPVLGDPQLVRVDLELTSQVSGFPVEVLARVRYKEGGVERTVDCLYSSQDENGQIHRTETFLFKSDFEFLGWDLLGTSSSSFYKASRRGKYFQKCDCDVGYTGTWVKYYPSASKVIAAIFPNLAQNYYLYDMANQSQPYANYMGHCVPLKNFTIVNNSDKELILVFPKPAEKAKDNIGGTPEDRISIFPYSTKVIEVGEWMYDMVQISVIPGFSGYSHSVTLGTRPSIAVSDGYPAQFQNVQVPLESTLTINP